MLLFSSLRGTPRAGGDVDVVVGDDGACTEANVVDVLGYFCKSAAADVDVFVPAMASLGGPRGECLFTSMATDSTICFLVVVFFLKVEVGPGSGFLG